MSLYGGVTRLVLGTERGMRRLLSYWAATGLFYVVCIALLQFQIEAGNAHREAGRILSWLALGGVLVFYCMVRVSAVLNLKASMLAMMQSVFAITCSVAAYALTGPMRGSTLMPLLVVIVFCVFSLRPRQTLLLGALAIAALGATMVWMTRYDPAAYPARVEAMHFTLAALSIGAVTVLTAEMGKLRARLKRQKEELVAAVDTIRTLATVDELTSLANRRHMKDVLETAERRHCGAGAQVCIALLDIDHFKQVNDHYGHAGGDVVLRAFAVAARTDLRTADVFARWGGEEFLLMLPETGIEEALQVLERMAERVGQLRLPEIDPALRITFSGGVVVRGEDEPFSETISRADKAMYVAKTSGRNQVVSR
jgi:diguanylate cyclase (GGDEF)-like protein